MTRRVVPAVLFCFTAALAQAKPNLNGASGFNAAATDYGPLPNKPDKIAMTIEQSADGKTLKQARHIIVTQGEFDQTLVFDKQ